MRMEQIKYFLEVAVSGSMTSAASQLFISQQALSQTLRKLEEELNLTLFVRSKTGVELTEDGRFFASHAVDILEHYQLFESELAKKNTPKQSNTEGNLLVYTTPLLANTLLTDVLSIVCQKYPLLHIHCMENNPLEIINGMKNQEADLGLLSLSMNFEKAQLGVLEPEVFYRKMFEDSVVACVSKTSQLSLKNHLSLAEYQQCKRIHCNYLDGSGLDMVSKENNVLMLSNNTALHEKFISQNIAISALPSTFYEKIFPSPEIMALPIKPELKVGHYLLQKKGQLSVAAEIFVSTLNEYIEQLLKEAIAIDSK